MSPQFHHPDKQSLSRMVCGVFVLLLLTMQAGYSQTAVSGKSAGPLSQQRLLSSAYLHNSPDDNSLRITTNNLIYKVSQAGQAIGFVTVITCCGFDSPVDLSVSGMPSGSTISFNPNPLPAPGKGVSNFFITLGVQTPIGTYPITITATGGGQKASVTILLVATAHPGN